MNNIEQSKKEFSLNVLKKAIETNELERVILGYPGYCIEYTDEQGKKHPNIKYIVESIYTYYKENPDSQIDKKAYAILLNAAQNYKNSASIRSLLGFVGYQINAESFNISPFKMDNITLLKSIEENLNRNKELYGLEAYNEFQKSYEIIDNSFIK